MLPVSKAEICDILPDVSPSTVEAVLGKMVKTGSVMKLGQARATKYVKCKKQGEKWIIGKVNQRGWLAIVLK